MREFVFDLALGLGIAAAVVVIIEGIFRVAEFTQRIVGRHVLRRKMLDELNRALDNPKAAFQPSRGTSKAIDEHQAFPCPGHQGGEGGRGAQPPRNPPNTSGGVYS